jgi:hypothetical protein
MTGFTTTQLTAIETAIASGELTVEYEGKKVTYRSMSDLRQARDLIRADLIASGSLTNPNTRRSVTAFSRDGGCS